MATSFSPLRTSSGETTQLRLAEVVDALVPGPLPIRFTAYDGSATGPAAARGTAGLASRPGGAAPLQAAGRRGDPPPLRRLEQVLRVPARPHDDVHRRLLPDRDEHARRGADVQVRPRLSQARPAAGAAT